MKIPAVRRSIGTALRVAIGLVVLSLNACGYHFVGQVPQLPKEIRSIAVSEISNATREPGIEKSLVFAFEREIHMRRHYRMEQNTARADALLTGTIRRLDRRPVAFDQNDQAVIYQVTLVIDLRLARRDTGAVLWSRRGMKRIEEYSASPRVVVTSSSEFQRGTLNPTDLPRDADDEIPDTQQISAIQLAESERQRATERLFGAVVRDAYDSIVEGF